MSTPEITTYEIPTATGPVTVEVQEQAGYTRTPEQERELRELLEALAAAGEL